MYKFNFWLRILLIGFILYVTTLVILVLTRNSNLFPTVVFIGNFLVPVSFVTFFYEMRDRFSVDISATSMSFLYGGVLGTITAALLEPFFIRSLTFSTAFIVGLIEEFTKIIGVVIIARRRSFNSEMDGIVLGAAAGMGFAAFESSGYAFTAFLQSSGNLSEVVLVTLIRGIVSPVGHGTWTAILACVLLRESVAGRFKINYEVIKAYLTVAVLHGLWDGLPLVISAVIPSVHAVLAGQAAIGTIGCILLYKRWREARMASILYPGG